MVNTVHSGWEPTGPVEGVLLSFADRTPLRLTVPDGAAVYERIAEAVDAWWQQDGSVRTALVQKGPHDARAWLRLLRGLGARATVGYRDATIADELWRTVEDAAASPDARAGAAAALTRSLGDEGRARLRDAARKTAQPKLRIAIEAAACDRDDDRALLEALAEIEASPLAPGPRAL